MSKHLGNILEPIPLMDRHGADAVRWFMACSGSPWSARRVGHKVARGDRLEGPADVLDDRVVPVAVRAGQRLDARGREPARAAGARPVGAVARSTRWPPRSTPRWRTTTPPAPAGRSPPTSTTCPTGTSAARGGGSGTATRPRSATLHECLRRADPADGAVRRRSSPNSVWAALFAGQDGMPDSVHLADVARTADPSVVDPTLDEQVALVRRLVELGRSARAESKMKTRQPLARALVSAPGWTALPAELQEQVRDELNVVELARLGDAGELVELVGQAELPRAGKPFRQAHAGGGQRDRRGGPRSRSSRRYRAGTATRRARRRDAGDRGRRGRRQPRRPARAGRSPRPAPTPSRSTSN